MTGLSLTRLSVLLVSFLGVTYTLCVLYGLIAPSSYQMHTAWEDWLPGFEWLTWGDFFIGLGEVIGFGIYTAVLYALLRGLVQWLPIRG